MFLWKQAMQEFWHPILTFSTLDIFEWWIFAGTINDREALPLLKPYKEKENGSFKVSSCWMRAELIEASWEEL